VTAPLPAAFDLEPAELDPEEEEAEAGLEGCFGGSAATGGGDTARAEREAASSTCLAAAGAMSLSCCGTTPEPGGDLESCKLAAGVLTGVGTAFDDLS